MHKHGSPTWSMKVVDPICAREQFGKASKGWFAEPSEQFLEGFTRFFLLIFMCFSIFLIVFLMTWNFLPDLETISKDEMKMAPETRKALRRLPWCPPPQGFGQDQCKWGGWKSWRSRCIFCYLLGSEQNISWLVFSHI